MSTNSIHTLLQIPRGLVDTTDWPQCSQQAGHACLPHLEEEKVVVDAPSIVPHGLADVHGDGVCAYGLHHLLHSQRLQRQGLMRHFAVNAYSMV